MKNARLHIDTKRLPRPALIMAPAIALRAQEATIVYRLGHDTVAVEQFTRTPTRFAGETVIRSGPTVSRTQYDITLAGGKATAAVVRRRQADGSPIPNNPLEWRVHLPRRFGAPEIVWKDSTQSASFAAPNAFVAFPVYSYAPFELVFRTRRGAP